MPTIVLRAPPDFQTLRRPCLQFFSFYLSLGTSGYILLSSFVEDQVIHSLDLVELASKPLLSGSVIQVVEFRISLKISIIIQEPKFYYILDI